MEPQYSKQKKAIAVFIEVRSVVNRSSVLHVKLPTTKLFFRINFKPLLIDPSHHNTLNRENVLWLTIFLNFDDGGYSFVDILFKGNC